MPRLRWLGFTGFSWGSWGSWAAGKMARIPIPQAIKPSIVKELEIKHRNGKSPLNLSLHLRDLTLPRLITGWYMDVNQVAAVLPEISCEFLASAQADLRSSESEGPQPRSSLRIAPETWDDLTQIVRNECSISLEGAIMLKKKTKSPRYRTMFLSIQI